SVPALALLAFTPSSCDRLSTMACKTWIVLIPVSALLNLVCLQWIGQPLLSTGSWHAVTSLLPKLTGFITQGVVTGGLLITFAAGLIAVVLPRLANQVSKFLHARFAGMRSTHLACIAFALSIAASVPAWIDRKQTRESMLNAPGLHPFCMIGLARSSWVGPAATQPSSHATGSNYPDIDDHANKSNAGGIVQARARRVRQLSTIADAPNRSRPDIVLVIVESLRKELVDEEVMPNLADLANRGLMCRNHFSGGNATNHGIFSIVSGMEAVWYDTDLKYSPSLNRLLRTAGYEIGFFAGENDWRTFLMDGFINADHYDRFDSRPRAGLTSDRRAIELASDFLNRSSDGLTTDQDKPRMAVVYLYSTHAMYQSFAEDQIFDPAADDRFIYPYSSKMQPLVWNRYKNSARSMDRLLSTVIREDRVIVITGDHGEAFLEDTTIGHGIRISEFQNMTPAVVHIPHSQPRVIHSPTSHADLLPTILSAIDLRLTNATTLDGVSLLDATEEELADRTFTTRNYLQPDVGMIGPWTSVPEQPFAIRGTVSLSKSIVDPLNPIDRRGFEITPQTPMADLETAFSNWFEMQQLRSFGRPEQPEHYAPQ
ncbi:MAG: sulfatase-like hydrolase/transferase, partial [Rubripirellula sp.]